MRVNIYIYIYIIVLFGFGFLGLVQISDKSILESNDNEWWFSYRRRYMNSKGTNSIRKTRTGYWKSTGKVKDIGCIGRRRILTFHENGVKPAKPTGWAIHEYYYAVSRDQVIFPFM